MSDVLQAIITESLVPVLAAIVLAIVGWAASAARKYLLARVEGVKVERVRNALEALVTAADTAVRETAQTGVDALKAASADGKLTAAERQAALNAATKRAWAILGPELRAILAGFVGGSTGTALEQIVKPAVEAAVDKRKATAGAAGAAEREVSEAVLAREAALAQARLGVQ